MSEKEIVNDMVNIFDTLASINELLKDLKEKAKTTGYDAGILATIAKSVSDGKSGKLRGRYESTLDLLDKIDE